MAEVHAISEILLVSSNPTNKDEKIAMLSGNTVCNNCNLSNIIINFRKVSGTISFGLFITEEQKNYRIKIRGYVRDKRNNNLSLHHLQAFVTTLLRGSISRGACST